MTVCALPRLRPISCNNCRASKPHIKSAFCVAGSLQPRCGKETPPFRENPYPRQRCIDHLNRQDLPGRGRWSSPIFPVDGLIALYSAHSETCGKAMAMTAGTCLGSYEILSCHWCGRDRSRVYRPRDTRLDRIAARGAHYFGLVAHSEANAQA